MDDITFVTSNDNKLRDAEEALGVKLTRINLDLDELQHMDLKPIVEHKARQAYDIIKKPVMVEDVGLYIDAWQGFPGPFIKWMHESVGYEAVPAMIPVNNRSLIWNVTYGYYDGKNYASFEGATKGSASPEARGTKAWGFGIFFIPDGETKTLAEMDSWIQYSARAKALYKLKAFLEKSKS